MLMVESVSAVSWLEEQPERLTRQADRRTAAAILFTNRLIYMSPLLKPCHASWKDGPHFLCTASQKRRSLSDGSLLP